MVKILLKTVLPELALDFETLKAVLRIYPPSQSSLSVVALY